MDTLTKAGLNKNERILDELKLDLAHNPRDRARGFWCLRSLRTKKEIFRVYNISPFEKDEALTSAIKFIKKEYPEDYNRVLEGML